MLATLTLPPSQTSAIRLPPHLQAGGFSARAACDADIPFMRELYGELRAGELEALLWPKSAKWAFLDYQFALQHRHYVSYYAPGDFLLIEHRETPIGRLYVHHGKPDFVLVDIALMPPWRGKGIGTALIRAAQDTAQQASARGLILQVEQRNIAARRLYERMGFTLTGESDGQRFEMVWPCCAESIEGLG
ncbi:GNAT family N-acetyltransferase [Dyella subtropica]|uniref:GNAT family N-acetyltransferase n=1 Tax=Dyella subtropica TaxID=2992127 RepID=UPI002253F684|nr:GNAT family N-acetyltransferase [Dyella subtropica]